MVRGARCTPLLSNVVSVATCRKTGSFLAILEGIDVFHTRHSQLEIIIFLLDKKN